MSNLSPKWARRGLSLLVGALIIAGWEFASRITPYPALLPPPGAILARLLEVIAEGTIWRHLAATTVEVLLGLASGLALALVLGYALAKNRLLEQVVAPYIVALQAVPMVALAPLLVIIFGPGLVSKVIVCMLIVFFPMLVNTLVGVRQVEPTLHDLMRSLNATWWQTLTQLEIPAALPILFGGLKVSATLSVIGAVVGEMIGSNAGLGFWVNVGRANFDTELVYVAIFALTALALTLYGTIGLLERRFLQWQRVGHGRKDVL
jgi:NitT/TauT family transport system permease protein